MEIRLNLVKISVSSNPYKSSQCRHFRPTEGALQEASITDRQNWTHIVNIIEYGVMFCAGNKLSLSSDTRNGGQRYFRNRL